jgi:processive 1,2-diacylglycerol beta-glucosyltransferase
MIRIFDTQDDTLIGEIQEEQLQYLVDQMEEESLEDQDYAITALTLAYFADAGGDPVLLDMLRSALGEREEMVIRWQRA